MKWKLTQLPREEEIFNINPWRMTTRYLTALSHVVLAGTGIYCYIGAKDHPYFYPKCCFGVIIVNSLIGIWRWGKLKNNSQIFELLIIYVSLLALIYCCCSWKYEVAWILKHFFMSAFPLLMAKALFPNCFECRILDM